MRCTYIHRIEHLIIAVYTFKLVSESERLGFCTVYGTISIMFNVFCQYSKYLTVQVLLSSIFTPMQQHPVTVMNTFLRPCPHA